MELQETVNCSRRETLQETGKYKRHETSRDRKLEEQSIKKRQTAPFHQHFLRIQMNRRTIINLLVYYYITLDTNS